MSGRDFRAGIEQLDQGVTRMQIAGDVDIAVAPELKRLADAVVDEGHRTLLVDVSEATLLDSTALGILLYLARRLQRLGGRLAVFCPDRSTRELFELVGLNLLFAVDDTLERALGHLGARPSLLPRLRSTPISLAGWRRAANM